MIGRPKIQILIGVHEIKDFLPSHRILIPLNMKISASIGPLNPRLKNTMGMGPLIFSLHG